MLILSRKKNESVQIGDLVSVTVTRVAGNKVRLGVVAPDNMQVLRLELRARQIANEAASEPDAA